MSDQQIEVCDCWPAEDMPIKLYHYRGEHKSTSEIENIIKNRWMKQPVRCTICGKEDSANRMYLNGGWRCWKCKMIDEIDEWKKDEMKKKLEE